ncbi:MAG: RNA polymerase sigma-54 factor [Candidatus Firestonebacteria bacterium RIFOXYA2_FULL_40_8]|nr:MAG: RNA polymerase sigma-54 factor [Candidatus Firestonebacteria bacterium RIFOXYA2_FULL_40_8]
MADNQRLELRQGQRLILSPLLQQSLKILQLPAIELKEYIDEELEKNPVLETTEREPELPEAEKDDGSLDIEKLAEHFAKEGSGSSTYEERDRSQKPDIDYENMISTKYSLEEHLLFQLHMSDIPEEELKAGEYLIGNINEDGYLLVSVEETAEKAGVGLENAVKALALIQGFDPTGVGAKNLRECLEIQLKAKGLEATLSYKLLDLYWEEFEKGHLEAVAEKEKISVQEIYKAIEVISKLEPKPGLAVNDSEVRYIVPDILVERDENGSFRISLNNEGVPFLKISKFYREMSRKINITPEEKKFLKDKFSSAVWLINAIGQRKTTLLKVTAAIIEAQKEFMEHGMDYLKPLALKEISEKIGMHQSTVSRVTAGKYVQTPKGIFPFRFFFNVKIETGEGEPGVASRAVKDAIKNIIEEDKDGNMSDSKIQTVLLGMGFKVSRRTVAKYREGMKILPAIKRKILGKMKGGSLQ